MFPLMLHFLDIENVPMPLLFVAVKLSPLKDNVCPDAIDCVGDPADNVIQFPDPSTQYSHVLFDKYADNPSSNASIVR